MSTAYEHKTELVGDDYEGLPTRPVTYRGARKGSSIDWDQITENYVAAGGQVDASVWPNHGKVVVIGGSANSSRANIHTFTEADEYAEPATPKRTRAKKTPATPTPRKTSLDASHRPEIARRYQAGETMTQLATAYGVTTGSISFALKKMNVQMRDRQQVWDLRRERNAS